MNELIFISGPISGIDNYEDNFNNAEEYLKSLGFTNIINPTKIMKVLPKEIEYKKALNIDLAMVKQCKYIYMLNGWQDSNGANQEITCAAQEGLDIFYQDESTIEKFIRDNDSCA